MGGVSFEHKTSCVTIVSDHVDSKLLCSFRTLIYLKRHGLFCFHGMSPRIKTICTLFSMHKNTYI